MNQLTVTLRLVVNDTEMTWNDFCHEHPDEADEIIQRMIDIKDGLTGMVFDTEEEQPGRRFPVDSLDKGSFNERVLHLIAQKDGVTTEELVRKTNSDKKRVWNIIHFLRTKKGYRIQKIGDRYHLMM